MDNDLVTIVRKYQKYDVATRTFIVERTLAEYAEKLGVHESNLSRFYTGQVQSPWAILRGLARFAPEADAELVLFLRSNLPVSRNELQISTIDDASLVETRALLTV